MNPEDTDFRCHHCDSVPSSWELADGWCDTCGKRLPEWFVTRPRKQGTAMSPYDTAAPSTGQAFWGGLLVAVVTTLAAVAVAVAG